MTPRIHTAALALLVLAVAATALGGEPTGPDWIRLLGLVVAVPALLLCICTVPGAER